MEILDVFGTQINKNKQNPSQNNQNISHQSNLSEEGGFLLFSNSEIQNPPTKTTDEEKQKQLTESLSSLENFKEWLLAPYDFQSHKFFQKNKLSKKKRKSMENSDSDSDNNGDVEIDGNQKIEENSQLKKIVRLLSNIDLLLMKYNRKSFQRNILE